MTSSSNSSDARQAATRLRCRRRRGAAELFGVLALVTFAALALTAWTLAEFRGQTLSARMTAGHVAAAWFKAMHRSTQVDDWTAAVAAGGAVVTPAVLTAAGHPAPGLPATQRAMTMTLGVVSDGTAEAVPMAFLVVDPASPAASAGIHAGLIEAGVPGVEHAAGPPGAMAPHRAAIEALAGPLAGSAFYVTADYGLAYVPEALYRRPQPGRPRLNLMETDLDLARNDIAAAAALHAGAIDHLDAGIDPLDPDTWPGVTLVSATAVSTAGVVADPASLIPGTTTIDPLTTSPGPRAATLDAASSATFDTFEGTALAAAAGLTVTADLAVGSLVSGAALTSASATVSGHLQAAGLGATTLTAQATTIAGATTVAGAVATPEAAAATIAGSPRVDTTTIAATGGVYGPHLRITGRLDAGSCSGC